MAGSSVLPLYPRVFLVVILSHPQIYLTGYVPLAGFVLNSTICGCSKEYCILKIRAVDRTSHSLVRMILGRVTVPR